MEELGLCQFDETKEEYVFNPKLTGWKCMYPAMPGEKFIPCNNLLFCLTLSSDNCQRCDLYMSARYLAKHVQGIDEHSRAVVHACSREAAEITQQNVMNTKITSSKINEQKRKISNRACCKPQGRINGLM